MFHGNGLGKRLLSWEFLVLLGNLKSETSSEQSLRGKIRPYLTSKSGS